eukprot:GEMP01037475.1.p1 GENE.GEMP01037475.1~~GEMP01037475.1.p1  ORF type:complete len:335 (+),score=43.67 GEMP01037475.1:142-1146(+)
MGAASSCCSCTCTAISSFRRKVRNLLTRGWRGHDTSSLLQGGLLQFEDANSVATSLSMVSIVEDTYLQNVIGMTRENAKYYHMALQMSSPSSSKSGWLNCLDSPKLQAKASYQYTRGDSFAWISLIFELDANIAEVGASTHETDLWHTWHPIVYSNELLGVKETWRQKCHWKKSIAMGLIQGDVVPDIHRFVDQDLLFLIEHVQPLDAKDRFYVPPIQGLQRELLESATLIIPIGTEKTLVLTTLRIEFGMTPPAPMVRSILPTLASQSVSTYNKTMKMIRDPKKGAEWRMRMDADEDGVYAVLRSLATKSLTMPGPSELSYLSPAVAFQCFLS